MQVLSTDIDLLHPPADLEKQKHKTKRLVQSPNSFFMDVKCQGCFQMWASLLDSLVSC
jgi:small subunit ribosomal protein S27e